MHFESVFVTGSNRGLGLQFVQQLLQLDSPPKHIFASCSNPHNAQKLVELKNNYSAGTNVHILQLNLPNEEQIAQCVAETTKILGGRGLTLLINNAGIMPHNLFPNITAEEYLQAYKVNVMGPMLLTQAFLPLLKLAALQNGADDTLKVNRACILNIAAGIASFHDVNLRIWCEIDTYRMTKATFHMGSAIQARELRPANVLVLLVHPGWVSTDLGGTMAPITPEESVKSMLGLLKTAGQEEHGILLDYQGNRLNW